MISAAPAIARISTQMFATPRNGRIIGQKSDAVHEATDMYLSVKSTSKNSAIAMSVILQSTDQIVAKPAMNALPPLNLYHTGKQ